MDIICYNETKPNHTHPPPSTRGGINRGEEGRTMAPPKKGTKEYVKANPSFGIKFVQTKTYYQDQYGSQQVQIGYMKQPNTGYDILTDDVLGTGDPKVLKDFRDKNAAALNQPKNALAKHYLDTRIQVADKVEQLGEKAKADAALGKKPKKHEVVATEDGFIGIPDLKYDNFQTSGNGCWSCAYSLLLKSRGVNLSQEEIRCWRPSVDPNAPQDQKLRSERMLNMNSDSPNSIFTNSDLTAKLLPNTATNQLHMDPYNPGFVFCNGAPLNAEQRKLYYTEYKRQAANKLSEQITQAITEHQSPVAIQWGGHYVTVTGIGLDGTLRLQNSLGAHGSLDQTITVDKLVDQALMPHRVLHKGKYVTVAGSGLEMEWLSDLPAPTFGTEEKPTLSEEHKDYLKVGENGSVSVNVPENNNGVNATGKPSEGQVDSAGVENMFVMDVSQIEAQLGGKVTGIGVGEGVMFGTTSTRYPKKVQEIGDPVYAHDALAPHKDLFTDLDYDLDLMGRESETHPELKNKLKSFREQLNVLRIVGGTNYRKRLQKDGKLEYNYEYDVPNAVEKMKELSSFLMEKQADGDDAGKTYLEILEENRVSYGKKPGFYDRLTQLGNVLDIPLNGQELAKQAEQERIRDGCPAPQMTQEYMDYIKLRNEYGDAARNSFYSDKRNDPQERSTRLFCLAGLIAVDTLRKEKIAQGEARPKIDKKEVNKYAAKIVNEKAFLNMIRASEGMIYQFYMKEGELANMLAASNKRIQEEKRKAQEAEKETERYAIKPEALEVKKTRFAQILARLDATGTGSYTGLGFDKRARNSLQYNYARAAVHGITTAQAPSAKDVQTATETVLAYLDGKETVRKRAFGRERWNEYMKFLKETMPRDKMEAYCKYVNEKRGVGPGHKDFVAPESFLDPQTTTQSLLNETYKRIQADEGTLRDYALLAATWQFASGTDGVARERPIATEADRQALIQTTERFMANPLIVDMFQNTPKEELLANHGKDLMAKCWSMDSLLEEQKNAQAQINSNGEQPETTSRHATL